MAGNTAAAKLVEVMDGRLFWLPATATSSSDKGPSLLLLGSAVETGEVVDAMSLCQASDKSSAMDTESYSVPHYGEQAKGRAFGPLGFASMIWFCRNLTAMMDSVESCVVLTTPPGDENARTNAAVMLGAFLAFDSAWSSQKLVSVLRDDAERRFVCSWARKDRREPPRNMMVKDCWDGFEVALKQGWIDTTCFGSNEGAGYVCKAWEQTVLSYDAAWLVPGSILVCADPVTTACDPNPSTFSEVFPTEVGDAAASDNKENIGNAFQMAQCASMIPQKSQPAPAPRQLGVISCDDRNNMAVTESTGSPPSDDIDLMDTEISAPDVLTKQDLDGNSTDTVCKEYRNVFLAANMANMDSSDKPQCFVSFLLEAGVSMVVRTNFFQEPGMPKSGSYDASTLKSFCMRHTDIPIVDLNGGLPRRADVRKMLQTCPEFSRGEGAVTVHCKGGFGRSVMLACCLAIERFDVPGAAMLGWLRVVRPGAVNTPEQEQFLKRFAGRTDIRKFAGLSGPRISEVHSHRTAEIEEGPQPKCGCSVQ